MVIGNVLGCPISFTPSMAHAGAASNDSSDAVVSRVMGLLLISPRARTDRYIVTVCIMGPLSQFHQSSRARHQAGSRARREDHSGPAPTCRARGPVIALYNTPDSKA